MHHLHGNPLVKGDRMVCTCVSNHTVRSLSLALALARALSRPLSLSLSLSLSRCLSCALSLSLSFYVLRLPLATARLMAILY